jgi:hypothetical protein
VARNVREQLAATNDLSRPDLGDWVWNISLYPVAFVALALVVHTLGRVLPGTDGSFGYQPTVISYVLGMLMWWFPGVAAALACVAVASRLKSPRFRALAKLAIPPVVVGGWIAFAVSDLIYLTTNGGQGISVTGWTAVAVALIAVGAFTRVEGSPRPPDRPRS